MVAEDLEVLNVVRGALPFPITVAENVEESIGEDIRLRWGKLPWPQISALMQVDLIFSFVGSVNQSGTATWTSGGPKW